MKTAFKHLRDIGWLTLWLAAAVGLVGASSYAQRAAVSPEERAARNQRLAEGDILLARKEHYPALLKYLEASRLNPDNEIIFNKLGIVYSQLTLHREAIQSLNRSIGLNKRYAYAYNNLGSVYFATRDLRRAEKYFKKAIALNDHIASFHYNLGAVYFERRKFEQGKHEYQKALQLDRSIFGREDAINLKAPAETLNNPARHFHLAQIYASVPNVEKTIEALQTASNLGFKVVEAVDKEPVFDPLRQDKRFLDFIEDLRVLKAISQWK